MSDGLRALAEEGLAVRTPRGWTRGPADPTTVAEQLGVPELVTKILERYRTERAAWRTFLKIVERLEPDLDTEDLSFPEEVYALLGPPAWMRSEPHGPPG
ncbi:hypothetical protein [Nonomuraea dietziae]|uniref:hypothetical protein n=1 Tax=Nonomuraea dietziae TaxID=65515 RepID=UPI0031CFC18E